MNETEEMLKKLGLKTMFDIHEDEMEALVEEYEVFMNHVKALDAIDTDGVEPLAFPYMIETTYLRDDQPDHLITTEEGLSNTKYVQDNQIKVPKVVG